MFFYCNTFFELMLWNSQDGKSFCNWASMFKNTNLQRILKYCILTDGGGCLVVALAEPLKPEQPFFNIRFLS